MRWTAPPRKCTEVVADAEAICEAVTRANMRFVATKDAQAPKTRGTKMSTKSKDPAPKGVQRARHGELLPFMNQFASYLVDAAQRNVLFWDVMRPRR